MTYKYILASRTHLGVLLGAARFSTQNVNQDFFTLFKNKGRPVKGSLRESSGLRKIPTWRVPVRVSQVFLVKLARGSFNHIVSSQSSVSST